MAATREDIREWFQRGVEIPGRTHMIVVCDTWDYEDFPVYVLESEDIHKVQRREEDKSMQQVMEVYKLSMDMEEQIKERRAFNY